MFLVRLRRSQFADVPIEANDLDHAADIATMRAANDELPDDTEWADNQFDAIEMEAIND